MHPIPTRQATGGPRGCRAGCDLDRCLRRWFETPLGQRLSEFERQAAEQYLPRLFGQNIVQVGVRQAGQPLIADSPIRHRVVLDRDPLAGAVNVVGTASALPFASAGIDALLLDHVLEFEVDPHQALREAERVLTPEGALIVVGFNPSSLWGVRRWLQRHPGDAPWCGRFVGVTRLRDWLSLLGFDEVQVRTLFYRPPIGRGRWLGRLTRLEGWGARWWPALGGVYLVAARKRVVGLTPIKPRWRPRRGLLPGGYAEPTIRRTGTHG